MKTIKITVIRRAEYRDLMELYENELEEECCMTIGSTYIINDLVKPSGFCNVAWNILIPFIKSLDAGNEIFPGWMKNKESYMVSCNDGFRPVSYLLEVI
ncbi:MAG: TIGR04076 family protein [Acholeplasmatales bacterium]|nr:TIGR04076 family protein [Acholeplasmatales bacterium]